VATEVSVTVNVGEVSYDVELQPVQNGYQISRVMITAPTIYLYFDLPAQIFEIHVYSNVTYRVQVFGGIKSIVVNKQVAQDIQNFGFCTLWGLVSRQSPYSYAVNNLIAKILCALDTVVKNTAEASTEASVQSTETS